MCFLYKRNKILSKTYDSLLNPFDFITHLKNTKGKINFEILSKNKTKKQLQGFFQKCL